MDQSLPAYGLALPSVEDARASVERVYSHSAASVWSGLLAEAGLTGQESDQDSLTRLLGVMRGKDPALRLAAQALQVRVFSYHHLAKAHDITHEH